MNTSIVPIRPFALVKLATLAVLGLTLLFLNACDWVGQEGNGKVVTEERPVQGFQKVTFDGAFTVNWSNGPAKLSITTDQNLLPYIKSTESGDTLHVEWTEALRGTHGIKINLSSPTLVRAELNGATKMNADGLSGAEFYLEANGASRVNLSGQVSAMSGELNGASRLDANKLETRAMELSINGAGKAEVNVSQALKVSISGAGKVTYTGNPQVSRDISGAGKVEKRE